MPQDHDQLALARRFRPQKFAEVVGQDAIVTTLKNALKHQRVAHAYLFAGSRGTGKTTLARLLAKALNCLERTSEGDPCNTCRSCVEIQGGHSLDILEVDGASHRGIDDIRRLSEGVGYAAAGGSYKIYIIDEVHMLTKEAFNALLKTLEEPPPKVKFFFATTEPHKVPTTIRSRCQQFRLARIDCAIIAQKLRREADTLGITIDQEALQLISRRAQGAMRDAESLLDQVISFHGSPIDRIAVAQVLGLPSLELYFRLDEAAANDDLTAAYTITQEVLAEGKDLLFFLEGLMEHFRYRLLLHLDNKWPLPLSEEECTRYKQTQSTYNKEQCLAILDTLMEQQEALRYAPSKQLALEMILTQVLRMRHRIPIDLLVKRLIELEGRLGDDQPKPMSQPTPTTQPAVKQTVTPPKKAPLPDNIQPEGDQTQTPQVKKDISKEKEPPKAKPNVKVSQNKKVRYDTIMRFAAVELEGTVK